MKKQFKLLITLLITVLLVACSSGSGGSVKDTLIVASNAEAVTFDIQATNDTATTRVARQIYEPLIQQNEDLELVPGLATEWTQLDDTTYEFKLREGVTFHNGEPFTADDVAWTLHRAIGSSYIGHIVGALDPAKIVVVDDHTIQIGTKVPFGPFLTHLAHPATAILNEKAVTDGGDDYGTKPVGTGPFKLTSWVTGSEITLEAYDGYWGTAPASKKIVFKTIKEDSTRLIAVQTGEIDIAFDVAPTDLDQVKEDSNLTLVRDLNLATSYVGFNVAKDTPLKDKLVRQAINYAIDVEGILTSVYHGVGAPAVGPLNALAFGANKSLDPYGYDLNKAKDLLTQAGYPDGGFGISLFVGDNNAQRIAIAEIIKESLATLGIDVTIRQLEWGAYLDATATGDHDMYILGWTTVTTDADYGLYALFHSSQHGAPGNRSFYTNARVDELLDLGRTETDQSVREGYYHEAQEIINDEVPWVFVQDGENLTAIRNSVKGFKHHPTSTFFLSGVSVEE